MQINIPNIVIFVGIVWFILGLMAMYVVNNYTLKKKDDD